MRGASGGWVAQAAPLTRDRRRWRPVPASGFPGRLACTGSGGTWSPGNARPQLGRMAQALQHDAIALGQLQEAVDAVLRLVGVEREGQADRTKTDGGGAGDPQCAAEIEIAFGTDRAALQAEFERGRNGAECDPGAGAERFQEHIARAALQAAAAGR